MNKVLFSSLTLILVLLTGCEHLPVSSSNAAPSSELIPTNFSVVKSEKNLVEGVPSLAIQDFNKLSASWGANTEVPFDDFFLDPNKTQVPDVSLGESMDFDNFFSGTVQTKSSATAFNSVATKSSLGSISPVKPLEGTWGESMDFDNFLSDTVQTKSSATVFNSVTTKSSLGGVSSVKHLEGALGEPMDFDNFFSNTATSEFQFYAGKQVKITSEFQLDAGKQEEIKIIKEATITTQNNNVIADQIRNEDIDMQLITDLANLEKNIPIQEKELVQMMKDGLRHKIRLLDAETALKVAEIKMFSSAKSVNVVAKVEDRALSKTSGIRKELIRKMFISEPENYYQLKEQGKQLDAIYQVDIAKVKLQYQQKIDVVKSDIGSLRVANKKIIDNRFSELEAQRIAEAFTIEEKVKKTNQEVVNQSYPGLKAKILKYIDAFEIKLSQREAFILDRLKEEYISKKSSRNSARKLENRRYIAGINQQIEQEQNTYEDQSRDRLYSARDVKVDSIIKGQKRSINRVESDGAQKIAALKARHAREHEKQKNILQVPYKKKEQILNQKSQQFRSKALSRFNSENYAITAKEKKEIDVINREINARVKAEIKALLDSFEALRKEEADNKMKEVSEKKAKEIERLKKPKESPGFFESLF